MVYNNLNGYYYLIVPSPITSELATYGSSSCLGFDMSSHLLSEAKANDTQAAVCQPGGECPMMAPAVFVAGMIRGENAIRQYKGVLDAGTNRLRVFDVESEWSTTPISDVAPSLVDAFGKGFVAYHDMP